MEATLRFLLQRPQHKHQLRLQNCVYLFFSIFFFTITIKDLGGIKWIRALERRVADWMWRLIDSLLFPAGRMWSEGVYWTTWTECF